MLTSWILISTLFVQNHKRALLLPSFSVRNGFDLLIWICIFWISERERQTNATILLHIFRLQYNRIEYSLLIMKNTWNKWLNTNSIFSLKSHFFVSVVQLSFFSKERISIWDYHLRKLYASTCWHKRVFFFLFLC